MLPSRPRRDFELEDSFASSLPFLLVGRDLVLMLPLSCVFFCGLSVLISRFTLGLVEAVLSVFVTEESDFWLSTLKFRLIFGLLEGFFVFASVESALLSVELHKGCLLLHFLKEGDCMTFSDDRVLTLDCRFSGWELTDSRSDFLSLGVPVPGESLHTESD